ncbi:patatin-like phospholipase family protein [Cytophagaceae bacterium ABcell3]|nr:patatin-like phospholipase family protein [Cytophagaceae bacterium ABcell3]
MTRTGLGLSGGGARGVAHLGVIQALEEVGVKPTLISGVSSGAIIGTLYACGMSPKEIFDTLVKTNLFRYLRPAWSKFGFLNMERFINIYEKYLPCTDFSQLKTKLVISATDIVEGKTVFFSEGPILEPLLASTCMPVLFAPMQYKGQLLIDGGVLNNLPVEPLLGYCDFIVGSHCNPTNRDFQTMSMKSMVERTFHLAVKMNVIDRIKYCDLFIEPLDLINYGIFEISKAEEIYKIGYDYTINMLRSSKDILQKYNF